MIVVFLFLLLIGSPRAKQSDVIAHAKIQDLFETAKDPAQISDTLSLLGEIIKIQQPQFDESPPWGCTTKPYNNWYETDSKTCCLVPVTSVEDITAWAVSAGVKLHKNIKIQRGAWGLSLFAKDRIVKDETILSVPMNTTINTAMARGGVTRPKYPCFAEEEAPSELRGVENLENYWNQATLTLVLLHETYLPDTPLRSYMRILPREIPSQPLWYNGDHFSLLEHAYAYNDSAQMVQACATYYAYYYSQMQTHPKCAAHFGFPSFFTFEAFRWAFGIVMSRGYGVDSEREGHMSMIVPVWDLLNHNPDTHVVAEEIDYDGDPESFANGPPWDTFDLATPQQIAKGQQVFQQYEEQPDAGMFLKNYGFVTVGCMDVIVDGAPTLYLCSNMRSKSHGMNMLAKNKDLLKRFNNDTKQIFTWYKLQLLLKIRRYDAVLKSGKGENDIASETIRQQLQEERDFLDGIVEKVKLVIDYYIS